MVKDSKKYAATGGWGFGRFINGKPVDEAQHRACFACHQANGKARLRLPALGAVASQAAQPARPRVAGEFAKSAAF
jgi:hypothetical protein